MWLTQKTAYLCRFVYFFMLYFVLVLLRMVVLFGPKIKKNIWLIELSIKCRESRSLHIDSPQ